MEDDVNVWCYTVLELHARNDDDDDAQMLKIINTKNKNRWLPPAAV